MIVLSKFAGRIRPWSLILSNCQHSGKLRFNCGARKISYQAEIPDGSDGQRYKLYKRIFSATLFVATITTALILRKRKKTNLLDPRLPNASYQEKLFGKMRLIDYKGFSIPDAVVPTIEALENFDFRESDIVITSFPKTGMKIVNLLCNFLVISKNAN